ncbi:MAG: hypothetical protein QY323_05620 [Patescibacteria group bacterium]|nr:MAG: hypothetical protein QY323_05620 [Patescibacteria group bacterium]
MFDLFVSGLKGMLFLLVAIVAAMILVICGVIGGSIATIIATLAVAACWFGWEYYLYTEGMTPLVGGMISRWRGTEWVIRHDWPEIVLNLLFYWRLAFILPLVYLHL